MAAHDNFKLATRRAKNLEILSPKAVAAHYDRAHGRVVIDLNSRVQLSFSPRDAQGLERATPSQLQKIEISPSGFGIHFPELDADLYLPSLLEGFLGSQRWMASRLGQLGGKSKSAAKKEAAKANGRLGGRPRKTASG
jgi:hypothetical protein